MSMGQRFKKHATTFLLFAGILAVRSTFAEPFREIFSWSPRPSTS